MGSCLDVLGAIDPGTMLVLVDDQIHRDVVRQTLFVQRGYSNTTDLSSKVFQGCGQIPREGGQAATAGRIGADDTDVVHGFLRSKFTVDG